MEVGSERMLTPVSNDGSILPVPPPSSLDPVSNEESMDAPPAYTVRRGLQRAIRRRARHPYHRLSVEELAWARRLSRGNARSLVRSSGASDGVPAGLPTLRETRNEWRGAKADKLGRRLCSGRWDSR